MLEWLKKLRQYLLTGVSFAIPFIACGGILIASAIALAPKSTVAGEYADFSQTPILKFLLDIGVASFTLMPVVLAGYIANAIAGKPALVSGFVGGWLATHIPNAHPAAGAPAELSSGFLGAILAGLLAGYLVEGIKKIKVHKFVRPIMPILIIPIFSAVTVGFLMLKVVGLPIADLMSLMGRFLASMGSGNAVVLGLLLGAMIAFDMGGPINKAAFFFGAAMIKEGNYAVMGACAAAICVPPLGLGLATLVGRKFWTPEERESGVAALAMGVIGITEGAIPFAAADPLRVIPCIMAGSMVAGAIAMIGGVGDPAPHGGPIVLPVVTHRLWYLLAIVLGCLVTALSINALRAIAQWRRAASETVHA